MDNIKLLIGDSRYPVSGASGGSTTSGGVTSSTRRAAVDARDQLFAKVAPALKAQPEELEAVNATVRVKSDPSRSLSWKEACAKIGAMPMTVRGKNPDKSKPPDLTNSGVGGVQMADVSVDTETGIVRVNKMVAVQDCGLVVDVKTAESQVLGALIMGISYALYEEKILDPVTGRMLNPNMEFYRLAGIADIGELKVHMMTGKGYDERGVIGLAEPPVVSPGAAISNAVANAIGVRVPFLPLTPGARAGSAGARRRPHASRLNMSARRTKSRSRRCSASKAAILAGGTDLLALMKDDVVTPQRLVNIKQIDQLRGVSYQPGNGLRIGALTTIAEFAERCERAATLSGAGRSRERGCQPADSQPRNHRRQHVPASALLVLSQRHGSDGEDAGRQIHGG